jgi:hypothetical protein
VEGIKTAEIQRRMLQQDGDKSKTNLNMYLWIQMCKNGQTSVTDDSQSGHPSTVNTAGNVNKGNVTIQKKRVTTKAIPAELIISICSAHSITHSTLEFHTVCAR